MRRLSHRDALNLVLEEGSALVVSELKQIIENSRARYTAVLRDIALVVGGGVVLRHL